MTDSKDLKMRESMMQYENLREKYDLQLDANKEVIKNEYLGRVKDLEDEKKSLQEKLSSDMNHKSKLESFVIEKDENCPDFIIFFLDICVINHISKPLYKST